MEPNLHQQILQSYEDWFALNALYERWAKQYGLTSNALLTLYLIRSLPCCTQRMICEALVLPKQTVNSILDVFRRKGYLRLEVLPADRRSKRICFTAEGERYAFAILDGLERLEARTLEHLGPADRATKAYIDHRFVQCLGAALEELAPPKGGRPSEQEEEGTTDE